MSLLPQIYQTRYQNQWRYVSPRVKHTCWQPKTTTVIVEFYSNGIILFSINPLHNQSIPPCWIFTTIASLFQGTVAWMAPCYIIMIFLHNAAKRAHSTQKTLCKPQQRCQLLPWSTKHRLIKNLICQDLQHSLLLVQHLWHGKVVEESVQCLSYIDREEK